jgi:hypothetical protein
LATTIGKTVYSLYNNGKQRYYATQQSKCFLCGLIQGDITRTGVGSFSDVMEKLLFSSSVMDLVINYEV